MDSTDLLFGVNHDKRFYGIYRGIVADNNDPLNNNRLKIIVPQVTGTAVTNWASACRGSNYATSGLYSSIYAHLENKLTSNLTVASLAANAFTTVDFTDIAGAGISLDNTGTKITVSKKGDYKVNVDLSSHFGGTASTDQTFTYWLIVNGTPWPGSYKLFKMKSPAGHYFSVAAIDVLSLNAGDYFSVACAGDAAGWDLSYVAAFSNPARPTEWRSSMAVQLLSSVSPAIGDGVWIAYEGGDPNFPVWIGTF